MRNEETLHDGLLSTEEEIRKARQVLQEFYDDIVVSKKIYPSVEELLKPKASNDLFKTQLFKLVNDYPRICNLLMVLSDVIEKAQSTAIECLKSVGNWEGETTYVVG